MLREKSNSIARVIAAGIVLVTVLAFCCLTQFMSYAASEDPATPSSNPDRSAAAVSGAVADKSITEERISEIEKTLQAIKVIGERSEDRGYYIKMISRELISYVKVMIVVLIIIALSFPLTTWFMSRKRILGLSGLSSEIAATLVVVEERQAKLANVLKDIQGEIDYLHTMSVPDLKNLIDQAEKYLAQNEKDLGKAGFIKDRAPHGR